MKQHGYVGFGRVTKPAVMARDFEVEAKRKRLFDLPLLQSNIRDLANDPEMAEWVVGVEWIKTFTRNDARWFNGGFANQNIVC